MKLNRIILFILAVIISEEISPDDFEQILDEEINEYVYRYKKSIAERKDLMDIIEITFNITDRDLIEIKSLPNNLPYQGMIFSCLLISLRTR